MASIQILNFERFTQYDGLIKNYINTADAKSFKSAKFDDATRILSLYKAETTDGTADFTVEIPETDISGLLEKLTGATVGNVVTVGADGVVVDGGVLLSDLASKSEVTTVDEKVGTLADLETTAKDNVTNAINEIFDALSAGGTDAVVTCDTTTTTEGYLKSYTLKQGTNTICTIDIPKDLFAVSGSVVVNPDASHTGTFVKLVIENQTDPIYIDVGSLIDNYTAQASATQIQLAIDTSTREISATIVAGSVGTTELADGSVNTVKIADANVTAAKLADDAKNLFDSAGSATAAQTNAQNYADGLNTEMDTRVTELEGLVGDGFEVVTSDEISGLF